MHACMHAYIHTYIACMHACIHTYIHTYMHTYIRVYIHTCIHPYVYIYVYICTHTHTHTHTHVDSESSEKKRGAPQSHELAPQSHKLGPQRRLDSDSAEKDLSTYTYIHACIHTYACPHTYSILRKTFPLRIVGIRFRLGTFSQFLYQHCTCSAGKGTRFPQSAVCMYTLSVRALRRSVLYYNAHCCKKSALRTHTTHTSNLLYVHTPSAYMLLVLCIYICYVLILHTHIHAIRIRIRILHTYTHSQHACAQYIQR